MPTLTDIESVALSKMIVAKKNEVGLARKISYAPYTSGAVGILSGGASSVKIPRLVSVGDGTYDSTTKTTAAGTWSAKDMTLSVNTLNPVNVWIDDEDIVFTGIEQGLGKEIVNTLASKFTKKEDTTIFAGIAANTSITTTDAQTMGGTDLLNVLLAAKASIQNSEYYDNGAPIYLICNAAMRVNLQGAVMTMKDEISGLNVDTILDGVIVLPSRYLKQAGTAGSEYDTCIMLSPKALAFESVDVSKGGIKEYEKADKFGKGFKKLEKFGYLVTEETLIQNIKYQSAIAVVNNNINVKVTNADEFPTTGE